MKHWDLVDERCYRVVDATVRTLDAVGIPYVLGGGWAVFAHVPSTPSIDTDVYLRDDPDRAVLYRLRSMGFRIGPMQEIEFLSMAERYGFWAFGDEDLGVPLPGFCVEDVVETHAVRGTLALPGGQLETTVPDVGALALLKCCALANRDLAYRSFHDGRAGMLIGPGRMPQVHAQSQSYYLRKAGKDLFDLSLLLATPASREMCWRLAVENGLEDVLPRIMPDVDVAVVESAADLARHVGVREPGRVVEVALSAAP